MRNFAASVAVLLAFTSAVNAFQVTRAPRAPVRPRIGGVGQLQPARPPGLSLRAKALAAAAAPESVPEGEELVAAGGSGATAVVCDPYNPRLCDPIEIPKEQQKKFDLKRFVKLTTLFGIWYILNIGYNIGNKLVLTALPIPWTSATIELFFGFPLVAFLWGTGLRKVPKLSVGNVKTLSSQAFFLAATHVAGVISFGAGAISFTHILKATEPVWAALIGAVFFQDYLPLPVYLSLVPIIAGVGLASLKELSFTWLSFVAGTLSAVTSAMKAILSKKVLSGKPLGENLTPSNMFSVLTILGFLMILPLSLVIEGPAVVAKAWSGAIAAGYTPAHLMTLLSVSGALYYMYNEVAFLALNEVAPVTHAVTNTVKRVVIIVASILFFKTPVTFLGALGSAVAILGATGYSYAKGKCK